MQRNNPSFFNSSVEYRIGPASYSPNIHGLRKNVLPINDQSKYYIIEGGKLNQRVQPYSKGVPRSHRFKLDSSPAPGSYNVESQRSEFKILFNSSFYRFVKN